MVEAEGKHFDSTLDWRSRDGALELDAAGARFSSRAHHDLGVDCFRSGKERDRRSRTLDDCIELRAQGDCSTSRVGRDDEQALEIPASASAAIDSYGSGASELHERIDQVIERRGVLLVVVVRRE